jgi:phosphinothricin acetyltransferase
MNSSINIRLATEDDSAAMLAIYSEYIRNTAISFEYEVPSVSEFSNRIKNVTEKYPWLICEVNGECVGYAYASKHRERSAYQWSVDYSIYLKPEYYARHIATALYTALTELIRMQGYYNAYAGVTIPNEKSEGLHESFGFKPVGVYHNAGFKHGKWHDVKWYELTISEHASNPEATKTIDQIKQTEAYQNIIQKSIQMIKQF